MKSSIAPVRWTPPPAPPARTPTGIEVAVVALPGAGPEDTLIDADAAGRLPPDLVQRGRL